MGAMLDYHLFFGFALNTKKFEELNRVPCALRHLFIQNNPEYLQQIEYEGSWYLGKDLGPCVECDHLAQIEANIKSLLLKFFPDINETLSLQLLAIPAPYLEENHDRGK